MLIRYDIRTKYSNYSRDVLGWSYVEAPKGGWVQYDDIAKLENVSEFYDLSKRYAELNESDSKNLLKIKELKKENRMLKKGIQKASDDVNDNFTEDCPLALIDVVDDLNSLIKS